MDKLIPDLNGPKYKFNFKLIGFQLETEDDTYSELIKVDQNKVKTMRFENYYDYKKQKTAFSNSICKSLNDALAMEGKRRKWKRVCTLCIIYEGMEKKHYV